MTAEGCIEVMVVEDSAVARQLLVHILTSDPAIRVIACARSGEEAIAMLAEQKPDVVTMDIVLPKMDGFETTRQLMETRPLPIVIVSATYNANDITQTFRAMEAGAVAAVEKPAGVNDPAHALRAKRLIDTVKAMAEVRVIRRWPRSRQRQSEATPPPLAPVADIRLIAIGASTGGPVVLQTILSRLPKPLTIPVVIVQHISNGFISGLAEWLHGATGLPVKVASDGERLLPEWVYLAPDDCQMQVQRGGRIACLPAGAENGLRPSVSCLFRSVAAIYGSDAVGVLLTGMGKDGAAELRGMRDRGALTMAQDRESSVIFGMPGEAVKCEAAVHVLSPEAIGDALAALLVRAGTRGTNPS